jgi:hypothetical protein
MKPMLQRAFGCTSQSIRTSSKKSRRSSFRLEALETRTMLSLTIHPITLPIAPINLAVDTFSDGNFTSPAQTKAAPNDYTYDPTGSPWVFAGTAGVSGDGSGFTAGNPDVSAGNQVAFLQKNGIMSQSFELSQGTYSITFQSAQRQNAQSSFQAFEVSVDSTLVDLVVPATTDYTSYRSMNFTVEGTGLHTIEFKGVDPLSGNDTAFITKVQITAATATADPNEPAVLAQAVGDFHRDGSLTYSDMVGLFATAVADVPPITTTQHGTGKGSIFSQGGLSNLEMQCLQTLVDDAATFEMPADVSNLASKVVNGDPGNATYQHLGTGGVDVSVPLGNLVAATTADDYLGSSATQLQDLVNKWFLADDYPLPVSNDIYAPPSAPAPVAATAAVTSTVTAAVTSIVTAPVTSIVTAPATTSLFGTSGLPSYKDVLQGDLNDCWLMASLEAAALQTPAVIESMFHNEGNGVWTVRFYTGGTPTYVTVNDELPDGGDKYTHPASDGALWAALAEKAYAELFGNNNYGNLNHDGFSQGPLAEITGRGVWDTGFYLSIFGVTESDGTVTSEDHLASQIYQAFESGQLVTLGSNGNGTNGLVAANHMYALIGATKSDGAYSFTLGNPWGPDGNENSYGTGNRYPGTVSDLSENDLLSNFDYVAFTQGAGPVLATESGATASGGYGATADEMTTLALRDAAISSIGAFGAHARSSWSARRGG